MAKTKLLFSTPLYHASLADSGNFDMGELEKSCWSIAQDDEADKSGVMKTTIQAIQVMRL